jgi:electron transport complex protein RnfG
MLKLGLVLALYASVACVGLALVYTATEERIAGHARRNLEAALAELFPGAQDFQDISGSIESPGPGISFDAAYRIPREGPLTGVAIQATGSSYGGPITVLAGIGSGGTVAGVKILDHQDTPGLGANAASPSYFVDKGTKTTFYGQFAGKPVSDPFEVKGDVQAVTASTVTSRAIAALVKAAALAGKAWITGAPASPGGEKQ